MSEHQSITSEFRDTEEQFRMLVESVEEYAIYMLDARGHVMTWNSGAEKIKGYKAGEIIGKHFSCFYTADDVAAGRPGRNLDETARLGHYRDQGLRVRQDGSTFFTPRLCSPLCAIPPGKIRGFSKVTRDVSEQLRTREMEAAKIAAEKASKAKDDFLAALSHELRTPLTPALAAAGFLADNIEKMPPEFREEVDTIRRNVQLQARLIDDLLDLTRITRGKVELHFDNVDAHALIREALQIVQADTREKQLKISTALKAERHHIWADPVRIKQVFWNLMNNAVKFTPAGGQIDIGTANDAHGRFEFQISDNGIGIEPSRQEALFQPFEQGEPSITRQFGGLGLGLAISRHLVDMHDGSIAVQSRGRSHGTTFMVALDAVTEHVGRSRVPSRNPHKPTKPLRILLVEDHADTRRTLSRLLCYFGHEISVADCTRSAFEIVDSKEFDVVLAISDCRTAAAMK